MTNIRLSEGYLYSDKLKIAGAVDLVASYNGRLSIIDFKTSGKKKRKEYISNYFMQCAFYSMMLYELTGIICSQMVIIICIEEEKEGQVFIEKVSDWAPRAINLVKSFHSGVY